MNNKIDLGELYSTRLLVFLEDAPQTNKYRQVMLNKTQFKNVSDSVCGGAVKEGEWEAVEIMMGEDIYKLPDLKEINEG